MQEEVGNGRQLVGFHGGLDRAEKLRPGGVTEIAVGVLDDLAARRESPGVHAVAAAVNADPDLAALDVIHGAVGIEPVQMHVLGLSQAKVRPRRSGR